MYEYKLEKNEDVSSKRMEEMRAAHNEISGEMGIPNYLADDRAIWNVINRNIGYGQFRNYETGVYDFLIIFYLPPSAEEDWEKLGKEGLTALFEEYRDYKLEKHY